MLEVMMIIMIIAAILLIVAVLIQPGKGDLSAQFGGMGGQFGSMFGMQRTANFLTKFTQIVALVLIVLVLLSNRFFINRATIDDLREKTRTEGAPPVKNNPQQAPAPAQQPAK
jgi:preprotein translocase subunit SecG